MPRLGGEFLYRQLYNARKSGASVVYGAMCSSLSFSFSLEFPLTFCTFFFDPSQLTSTTKPQLSCRRNLTPLTFQRNGTFSLSTPTERVYLTTGSCKFFLFLSFICPRLELTQTFLVALASSRRICSVASKALLAGEQLPENLPRKQLENFWDDKKKESDSPSS